MGRRPGCKNRKTLVAELSALGANDPNYSTWTCDQLSSEIAKLQSAPQSPEPVLKEPVPTEPIPATPLIDTETARIIIDSARAQMQGIVLQYAPEGVTVRGAAIGIPERIQDELRRVYSCATTDAARQIVYSATSKLHMHMLALWHKKQVPGPETERNLSKRLRAAQSLLTRFESEGRQEAAAKQRAKVAELQAKLDVHK